MSLFLIISVISLDTIPPTIELNASLPSNITTNITILLSANFSDDGGFEGNFSLDRLSDASTEKNFTFISGENQTVYLNISKNSNIISAVIYLKGTTRIVDKEESVSCEGEFWIGNNACDRHYDGEWATHSIAGHGAGTVAQSGTSALIYENFTIFSKNAILVWQANNLQYSSPGPFETCYTSCWNGEEWTLLGSPAEGNYVMEPRINKFSIPSQCVSQNVLQIKYYISSSSGFSRFCKSFEAAVNWTDANFLLDVGTADGNYEWNQSGNFDTETTSDFSNEINQYLNNCNADNLGYCLVPLTLNLGAGVIEISNINITYEGNQSSEICIASDGICDTEWTVNNVTITYSDDYLSGSSSYPWNTSNYNDGIYNISLRIKDTAYNTGMSSKKIILDRTAPTFTYYYPRDNGAFTINTTNSTNTSLEKTFWYRVNDLSSIANCSLIFNNKINQTDISVQKGSYEQFKLNISTNISTTQYYNWSLVCTDIFGFQSSTDTRRFTLIVVGGFSGETTDFGNVNISNIENLTLEDTNSGKIKFSENVDLGGVSNINEYVKISYNRIEINSSTLPKLNKSATLYLYNVTYSDPRPLKDGSPCPSTICKEVDYYNNTFVFNVTQFSVYSSEETPPSDGNGGSGGGGGGGSKVCFERWVCTDWEPGVCPATSQQTRNCSDTNKCGTEANKPNELRTCFHYVPPEEEEIIEPEAKEEPIVAAQAEPTIEEPEPKLGMMAVTGAAIGTAYQQNPFTMGALTAFILGIVGLFIYSHAKDLKHWPFHFKFKNKKWLVLVILVLIIFILLFVHFILSSYFKGG